jgi:hypothetical protein
LSLNSANTPAHILRDLGHSDPTLDAGRITVVQAIVHELDLLAVRASRWAERLSKALAKGCQ